MRLLDLFCRAGGAGAGYALAGFSVVGVDLHPQPDYPFPFIQGDALTCDLSGFDAYHASPPCQKHSTMTNISRARGNDRSYVDLIAATRQRLQATGKPYVIENVVGAPLLAPVRLCGSSFNLRVRRHRLFECSWPIDAPPCLHQQQGRAIAVYGKRPGDRLPDGVHRARDLAEGREAMGIDWMRWADLTQAVPPAYTRFIGEHLLHYLREQAA